MEPEEWVYLGAVLIGVVIGAVLAVTMMIYFFGLRVY